jgi:hypothetical protein
MRHFVKVCRGCFATVRAIRDRPLSLELSDTAGRDRIYCPATLKRGASKRLPLQGRPKGRPNSFTAPVTADSPAEKLRRKQKGCISLRALPESMPFYLTAATAADNWPFSIARTRTPSYCGESQLA